MEITFIKNAGRPNILTSTRSIAEQLWMIELAGRTCYDSRAKFKLDDSYAFIRRLIKKGHESVLEHSNLTVSFEDVSRGFTHEIVRHRHCAFSQQSTRYVKVNNARIVINDDIDVDRPLDPDGLSLRCYVMKQLESYKALINLGYRPEDARQLLPIGIVSPIVVSSNFREWRHILRLRTAKEAHWEIRRVIRILLNELKYMVPCVFDDITYKDHPTKEHKSN